TPSACCTTSIRTLAGSLCRLRFSATTSTSLLPDGSAVTLPFTPLISTAAPWATEPCQRNGADCAWAIDPIVKTTEANTGIQQGGSLMKTSSCDVLAPGKGAEVRAFRRASRSGRLPARLNLCECWA